MASDRASALKDQVKRGLNGLQFRAPLGLCFSWIGVVAFLGGVLLVALDKLFRIFRLSGDWVSNAAVVSLAVVALDAIVATVMVNRRKRRARALNQAPPQPPRPPRWVGWVFLAIASVSIVIIGISRALGIR